MPIVLAPLTAALKSFMDWDFAKSIAANSKMINLNVVVEKEAQLINIAPVIHVTLMGVVISR